MTPTLEQLADRLDVVEKKLGITAPVVAKPSQADTSTVVTPARPTRDIARKPVNPKLMKSMLEVIASAAAVVVHDVIFAKGMAGDCLMLRGPKVTVSRVAMDDRGGYSAFIESKDALIEDVSSVGVSFYQSNFRTNPNSSGTIRRMVVVNPTDRGGQIRSNLRGSGVWFVFDSYFEGLNLGLNPLGKGDGGEGYIRTETTEHKLSNGDAIAKKVDAYAKTEHDPWKIALYFRSCGPRIWIDEAHKEKGDKPYTPSDQVLRDSLKRRQEMIDDRAAWTLSNCVNKFGHEFEPGSVTIFDGTNLVETSETFVRSHIDGEYPPPNTRLPFDKLRPAFIVILRGDTLNCAKGLGLNADQIATHFRGWCILNGQRVDFAPEKAAA